MRSNMNLMFPSLLRPKIDEDLRFTRLTSHGPYEVRLYQKMWSAKVSIQGEFNEAFKEGCQLLIDYIEGNNFKVARIGRPTSFFQVHKSSTWDIGMILPKTFTALNTPKPINRMVKIEELSPGKVGVLRYRGKTSRDIFHQKGDELAHWLLGRGLRTNGPLKVNLDNLMPLNYFKNNEIHVEII